MRASPPNTTAGSCRQICSRSGASCATRLERATAAVLAVTGHREPVETTPVLRRSIDVRNPYVDPINLVQIELLARLRQTVRRARAAARIRRHGQRHRGRDAEHAGDGAASRCEVRGAEVRQCEAWATRPIAS